MKKGICTLILSLVLVLGFGLPTFGADFLRFYATGVETPVSQVINYCGEITIDAIIVPWEKCEDRTFTEMITVNLPEDLVQVSIPDGCQWIHLSPEIKRLKCDLLCKVNCFPWLVACSSLVSETLYQDYVTQSFQFTENVCMSGETVIDATTKSYSGTVTDDDTGIVTEVSVGTPVTAFALYRTARAGKYTEIIELKKDGRSIGREIPNGKLAHGILEETRLEKHFTPSEPGLYTFIFTVKGTGVISRRVPLRVLGD